ncbi:DUF1593 domain-containing protein [Bremerella sp.]|uniref:DUF1593 domain-containing protein n=1 Tax=Bremerella sp. TaxID=2795602 RepID=UPI00391C488C
MAIHGSLRINALALISLLLTVTPAKAQQPAQPKIKDFTASSELYGQPYRVIVSTDIGGTDPDDFQSMVHLLVYADCLNIEGLISSPFGPGRKQHILDVIDCYEKDYPNLKTYSEKYPTPDGLRAITKQGETEAAPYTGVRESTEGSRWIVECARRDDPRPLHVLIWGGIEDLAQALHDAPDVLPKLRVYYIGGPNKKWGPDAYQYVADHHPSLWIIEANSTYRGWFTGGDKTGEWSNTEFVKQHIAGHGSLGEFFTSKLNAIKMGDTPSVGWLLKGSPEDPTQPGWGGSYVRAWERPFLKLNRMPTQDDRIEVFGVLEIALPTDGAKPTGQAAMSVENQRLGGYLAEDGTVRFRFCPKSTGHFHFAIASDIPGLDGKTGDIQVFLPPSESAKHDSNELPNWWTDDPSSKSAEGIHHGAASVSRWREDYLRDFASRMLRCSATKSDSN